MGKGVFALVLLLLSVSALAAETHYLITDTKNQRVLEVDNESNIVWEFKCSGNSCFCEKENCFYGFDSATRLDNGNTLFIDNIYNKILEIDIDGNTIWRYGTGNIGSYFNQMNHAMSAFRLPNGGTLVADTGNNRVIEVEGSKAVTWEYGCSNKFLDCGANTIYENLNSPSSAVLTKDGTILIADTYNDRVIEVTRSNEIVGGFGCNVYDVNKKCSPSEYNLLKPWFAVKLENSTLITDSGNNRVVEVDRNGEIIWRYGLRKGNGFDELNLPKSALQLKNGNILIADTGNNRVIEVEKKTKSTVFQYSSLNSPSYAEVAKINYERIRTGTPGCEQRGDGFSFTFDTTVHPKYTYVERKGESEKIYLLGKYENGRFISSPGRVTRSGQYTFYASYDKETKNYSAYCKLDALICNAMNLSISGCYLEGGVLNVTFSGLGEQSKFVNFNNMYIDIVADEKRWTEIGKRACGVRPEMDIQRFGIGSHVKKSGDDTYNFVAPVGMYNVRMVTMLLGECCQEDISGIPLYPKTKAIGSCKVVTGCTKDSECDDGNEFTADFCESKVCYNERRNVTCIKDSDCNDYSKCTNDLCIAGKCSYTDTCTGCSYCNPRQGCTTNESCLLEIERKEKEIEASNKKAAERSGERAAIRDSVKDGALIWYFVLGGIAIVAVAGVSGGAVFILMRGKTGKKEEREKVVEKPAAAPTQLTEKEMKKREEIVNAFGGEGNNGAGGGEKRGHTREMLSDALSKTESSVPTAPKKMGDIPPAQMPVTEERGHTRVMITDALKVAEGKTAASEETNGALPAKEESRSAPEPASSAPAPIAGVAEAGGAKAENQILEQTNAAPQAAMTQSAAPEKYSDFSKNVPDERAFRMPDGRMLKNLGDLLEALKNSTAEFFAAHVAADKNDFAEWVRDSFNDSMLSENIKGKKTKDELVAFLESVRPRS